ncbi:MAG: manganese efflux pump MntP family protein [Bradymonadales bacterium]|jgi:putative Mn2+ efflux pump MntP
MDEIIESMVLGFALAMDACAVSLVCGTQLGRIAPKRVLSMALPFGIAQMLMPIIGWFFGGFIQSWVQAIDHWIAFAILCILGIKFIVDAQKAEECPLLRQSIWLIASSALATSIDALVVGFSFALLERPILLTATIIGVITAILTALALVLGKRLGEKYGPRLHILGGITLICIGLHILYSHIFI